MVGIDYHSQEHAPDNLPEGQDEKVLNMSFPKEDDSAVEPPAASEEDGDQIVQIDFAANKATNADRAAEKIEFLNLENALLSDQDEEKAPPVETAPPATPFMSSSAPSLVPSQSVGNPILQTIEDLTEAAQESHRQFGWIRSEISKYAVLGPKIDALQRQVEHSNKLETANQKLFDTMHQELKGYKDSFLFESLQKPVIRDLLVLFDDLCGQARRIARFVSDNPADVHDPAAHKTESELLSARENINNTVHFLIEIFNRMEVVIEDGPHEKLDIKLHKVVGVEPTESPDEQNSIVRVVRPGFSWRDRLLRPTEVIVRKLPQPIRKSGRK